MSGSIRRRALAEFVGTGFLVAGVIGSGIAASRMSPHVVANLMFGLPAVQLSTHTRTGGGLWLGEVVATFGLALVIFGVVRSGRAGLAPFAVGANIWAAYFFTSSTSFATRRSRWVALCGNTFAGIRPASAPGKIASEVVVPDDKDGMQERHA